MSEAVRSESTIAERIAAHMTPTRKMWLGLFADIIHRIVEATPPSFHDEAKSKAKD